MCHMENVVIANGAQMSMKMYRIIQHEKADGIVPRVHRMLVHAVAIEGMKVALGLRGSAVKALLVVGSHAVASHIAQRVRVAMLGSLVVLVMEDRVMGRIQAGRDMFDVQDSPIVGDLVSQVGVVKEVEVRWTR